MREIQTFTATYFGEDALIKWFNQNKGYRFMQSKLLTLPANYQLKAFLQD